MSKFAFLVVYSSDPVVFLTPRYRLIASKRRILHPARYRLRSARYPYRSAAEKTHPALFANL